MGDIEGAWLTEAPDRWEGLASSSNNSIYWQTPDWIAPHVLLVLPAHSGVELIGVRDMERRLVGDAEEWAGYMRDEVAGGGDEEDPYFTLLEQFGSLLRPKAFSSLLAV